MSISDMRKNEPEQFRRDVARYVYADCATIVRMGTAWLFKPDENVGDDYAILCYVREKWDDEKMSMFCKYMRDILLDRVCLDDALVSQYQPGDYAESALRVVIKEEK